MNLNPYSVSCPHCNASSGSACTVVHYGITRNRRTAHADRYKKALSLAKAIDDGRLNLVRRYTINEAR